MGYNDFWESEEYEKPPDPRQEEARSHLEKFFEQNREEVFFSRQIEVQNEAKYFHWVANRAVSSKLNLPVDAPRELQDGTMLRFVRWHERNL